MADGRTACRGGVEPRCADVSLLDARSFLPCLHSFGRDPEGGAARRGGGSGDETLVWGNQKD